VFIILSVLRLMPIVKKLNRAKMILAIEEPENNLHPALLRRLLDFLANQRGALGLTLLLTTHSPVAIDWSAKRTDSQIIHVQHNGGSATATTVIGYQQQRAILDDLDIPASDILQANGIIWVEGPSDRIYLRRWLDLASEGTLKEGTHYSIMFYGGRLLAHLDGLPPDESNSLISLLYINRNVALLMDSDRRAGPPSAPEQQLNATKSRIKSELERGGRLSGSRRDVR
jgi:predicted ATP-dependent endonuclease of OLD family